MNPFFIAIYCLLTIMARSKTYTCVHDQLYKDYHPHTHVHKKKDEPMMVNIHGRQMTPLSRTPIRITLDTSDFDFVKQGTNGAGSTTTARLQFIKRAMQVAESFFQARLEVTRVSRIFAPTTCFDFDPPQNDINNGIASSDLHIYVQYITDKSQPYGATGVSCKVFDGKSIPDDTFQAGRPTFGRIKFNTFTLLDDRGISNDQALLTNRRFAAIAATAIHETMHILGFASNLFETYLDPRSSDGRRYDAADLLSTSSKLHGSRPESVLLKTPAVTQWAKDFFGCNSITGMQLQNEDETTPGSHWQRSVMYDQLMTGTQLGAQKGISGASFALLKDMGWYNVQDRFYDYTNYGYKKGCDFYNRVCYDATSRPKYFCNAATMSSISECSSNFLGKSVCTNQSALMADGCSMWVEYHHCVDPDQGDDGFRQFTLEQYRTDAFCITSTLGTSSVSEQSKSRCYPYVCNYTTGARFIRFSVGTYTVNCLESEAGNRKTISALAGYLECPNFNDYCVDSRKICKNWCSQNGICTRGICNCLPGFSGDDCSKTICTSNQYFNPANNSCGTSCPSGTYQNVFSRTCLPCASPCQECINQSTICSSCHSTVSNPQVFYNGICYSSCPSGTYKLGDVCYNCDSGPSANCRTCFGTATNCTSCLGGRILSAPDSGTCELSCQTNRTYPLQDRVNMKCVDACKDNLIESRDNSQNPSIPICVMCPQGQFKRISGCYPDCQPGYYENSTERFCKQCHSSCEFCDGSFAQNCTKCSNSSTNKYLLLKMCVSGCPAGYYANDAEGACSVCIPTLNCATCYLNSSDSKVYCSTCRYGFYLQKNNNTCLRNCDPYKYQNRWNHSCDDCSTECGDCTSPSESSCTNCRANRYFLSNQTGGYCLTDCPTLYYVKTGTNCLSCHRTCKTCNGVTSANCHSCVDGLYLYGGYCRYVCPEKTYPDKTSLKCESCDTKCKFCFGPTVDNCTSCETNLVLNNFTCTSSCPANYTVNQWNVCIKGEFYLGIFSLAAVLFLLLA